MALFVNIEKDFGRFRLNMHCVAGDEIHAFLGASGCGKSMTLRCVAGIERPDRGRIVLDGVTLFDSEKRINLPPGKRRVGLLFQNYALFPNMTAEQNIACGMRDKPRAFRRERTAELLRMLHLEELGRRLPSQLSGGQQQRVALARILAAEPKILMLDEPFSALDSYLRWQLEREVGAVLRVFSGTTLFVSHNRDEVYRLCDRISVVENGRLSVTDEKWALFRNPRTYAAALLTGCKNISRAERAGEYAVRALDWGGLLLQTAQPVTDAVRFVGVRARQIASAGEKAPVNVIAYRTVEAVEDTFSHIRMIVPQGVKAAAALRWEVNKHPGGGAPAWEGRIGISPEHILPLAE